MKLSRLIQDYSDHGEQVDSPKDLLPGFYKSTAMASVGPFDELDVFLERIHEDAKYRPYYNPTEFFEIWKEGYSALDDNQESFLNGGRFAPKGFALYHFDGTLKPKGSSLFLVDPRDLSSTFRSRKLDYKNFDSLPEDMRHLVSSVGLIVNDALNDSVWHKRVFPDEPRLLGAVEPDSASDIELSEDVIDPLHGKDNRYPYSLDNNLKAQNGMWVAVGYTKAEILQALQKVICV